MGSESDTIPPRVQPAPLRWRPLPLVGVFAQADYAAFLLVALWLAAIAACVWWAIAGGGFHWNRWHLQFAGLSLAYSFYLPWSVSVLLVLWCGLEWAAVPAYLATLFGSLHGGMPADLAVVYALHNPFAMAVYCLFYRARPGAYDLRRPHAWGWFFAASLVASLLSSIGALISHVGRGADSESPLADWLGWWPNALLQSLFVNWPLLWLLSPAVERLKQRYFPRLASRPFSPRERLAAVSLFGLSLALFILVENQWQQRHIAALLRAPFSEGVRAAIAWQFTVQQRLVWVLGALLIAGSLAGAALALRSVRRLLLRAEAPARRGRDELRRSEAKFRDFFVNSPAPMWVSDAVSGRFLEVNNAAVRRYGYTREQFLCMTIDDIGSEPDRGRLQRYLQSLGAVSEDYGVTEWRHRCKDGSLLDVELHVHPMRLDGRRVHLVLTHDITPRKHAEEALAERRRELQRLADASIEIAATHSVAGLLRVVAERARELLDAGVALVQAASSGPEAALWSIAPTSAKLPAGFGEGPDARRLLALGDEAAGPLRFDAAELAGLSLGEALAALTGGRPPNGLLAVPLRSRGGTGGLLLVADRRRGGFDAHDEALLAQLARVAAEALDNLRLTEALRRHTQELENRVAERTAELDASNRELDAFAYSVAHDLRAPLRAMHGFAAAVLEDYGQKLDETARGYLQRIVEAAGNMDRLIRDLLAYSRVGRDKMELGAVMLDEVVGEALGELEHEIRERRAAVECSVPRFQVLAHRDTLRRVIANLVSNAIKFVAPGREPEVRIGAESREGGVELTVADNGIGIAAEHQERIFRVFERLHGAETYPGTGIGLSIVKKSLERMHGEISVSSGETGSVFRVRLREYRHAGQ